MAHIAKGLLNFIPSDVETAVAGCGGVGGDVVLMVARRRHAVLLDAVGPGRGVFVWLTKLQDTKSRDRLLPQLFDPGSRNL